MSVVSSMVERLVGLVRPASDFHSVAAQWRRKPLATTGLTPDEAANRCRQYFAERVSAVEQVAFQAQIASEVELTRRSRHTHLVLGYA